MTKQEWLIEREKILGGQLTGEDMQRFYDIFMEKCSEDYKKTDFETFQQKFSQWFNQPIYLKNGIPIVVPQSTIVHNMIYYYDLKYNVTYLLDKNKNFIKAY